jgi:hypothetical protein
MSAIQETQSSSASVENREEENQQKDLNPSPDVLSLEQFSDFKVPSSTFSEIFTKPNVRCSIIAPSGSGKTVVLGNIVSAAAKAGINNFRFYTLDSYSEGSPAHFTPPCFFKDDFPEPEELENLMQRTREMVGYLKGVHPDSHDEVVQQNLWLLALDDMQGKMTKTGDLGEVIKNVATRGRHSACNSIMVAQGVMGLTPEWRINTNTLIILRMTDATQIEKIHTEMGVALDKKVFVELVRQSTVNHQALVYFAGKSHLRTVNPHKPDQLILQDFALLVPQCPVPQEHGMGSLRSRMYFHQYGQNGKVKTPSWLYQPDSRQVEIRKEENESTLDPETVKPPKQNTTKKAVLPQEKKKAQTTNAKKLSHHSKTKNFSFHTKFENKEALKTRVSPATAHKNEAQHRLQLRQRRPSLAGLRQRIDSLRRESLSDTLESSTAAITASTVATSAAADSGTSATLAPPPAEDTKNCSEDRTLPVLSMSKTSIPGMTVACDTEQQCSVSSATRTTPNQDTRNTATINTATTTTATATSTPQTISTPTAKSLKTSLCNVLETYRSPSNPSQPPKL